ncbi:chloride channel K isoform X2 [Phyllopteryx taeniolatus]|uniref:chloride channel K isoform X2 n=1 Tax=Phyllopteryx taeniolatus TaxID=161469 RepID=UPI002AD2AFA2|nr:chloride channel K isoform X2 [Phyllopteryx taeniolatus]
MMGSYLSRLCSLLQAPKEASLHAGGTRFGSHIGAAAQSGWPGGGWTCCRQQQRDANPRGGLEVPMLLGFVTQPELHMFLRRCSASQRVERHLDEVCSIQPPSALLSPHTIQEAFSILSLVGGQTVFITERGRLLGWVTWAEMKRILEDLAKEI